MASYSFIYQTLVGARPTQGQVPIVGSITDTFEYSPVIMDLCGNIFADNLLISSVEATEIAVNKLAATKITVSDLRVSKINGVAYMPNSANSRLVSANTSAHTNSSDAVTYEVASLASIYTSNNDITIGNTFTPATTGLYSVQYSLSGNPGSAAVATDNGKDSIQFYMLPEPSTNNDSIWTCCPAAISDPFVYKNTCYVFLTAGTAYEIRAAIRSYGAFGINDGSWSVAAAIRRVLNPPTQ